MKKELLNVLELARDFSEYKKKRISLIASENISSKLSLSSYLMGLCDQYCSGLPAEKHIVDNLSFGNVEPLYEINHIAREMVKKVFKAAECETRLLSGLNGFTVLLFSIINEGDVLYKIYDQHGGHLSINPIAKRLNIDVVEMKLGDNYRIDIDYFNSLYKQKKPNVIFLDSSYLLFPYPLKEIRNIVGDKTLIIYDASHVISLVANSLFQDPFSEGADIIHSTTHKSLWGPQKSILLFKDSNKNLKKIQDNIKIIVSNTHLHHIFSLLIAVIESRYFGKEYSEAVVSNNKYFARCLHELGFDVLASEYGYTESNQFMVRFESKAATVDAYKKFERINISTNVIFLPNNEWGLRVGTHELTRRGADHDFFQNLSAIMKDAFFNNEDEMYLSQKVIDLKDSIKEIKYSFDNTKLGKEVIDYFISQIRN